MDPDELTGPPTKPGRQVLSADAAVWRAVPNHEPGHRFRRRARGGVAPPAGPPLAGGAEADVRARHRGDRDIRLQPGEFRQGRRPETVREPEAETRLHRRHPAPPAAP